MGLSVLLIITYGLGLLFELKTHREFFSSADHVETGEAEWPLVGSRYARKCNCAVGRVCQRGVRRIGAASGNSARDLPRLCRVHHRGVGRWCGRDGFGVVRGT
jgi:Ca2+/H+ antiporter